MLSNEKPYSQIEWELPTKLLPKKKKYANSYKVYYIADSGFATS